MILIGLYYYVVVISLIIFSSLAYIYYKNTKDLKFSIFFAIGIFYLSKDAFVARAFELSFLFFILEFYIIEKLVMTGKKKYGFFLIIIGILLANLHSSVYPVFFVMFLPYLVSFFIVKLNIKLPKLEIINISNTKVFFVFFIFTLFTGFCSTAGTAPYTDMIKVMSGVSKEVITELNHSNMTNNPSIFIAFLVIVISCILTNKKIKITDIFYIIGFGAMALYTIRCTGFFWLVSGISINRILHGYIEGSKIFNNKYIKSLIFNFLIIIFILLIIESSINNIEKRFINEEKYPVGASDYIVENLNLDKIKIYNHFNFGSYMEYRGIKPFIDSRSGVFTTEFNSGCTILEDYIEVDNDDSKYKKLFDKYKITHCLLFANEEKVKLLENDSNWKLIYQDDSFVLFEKSLDN